MDLFRIANATDLALSSAFVRGDVVLALVFDAPVQLELVLPDSAVQIQPLLAPRAKAGVSRAAHRAVGTAAQWLGRSASGGEAKPLVARAPAPHVNAPTIAPGCTKLTDVVRQEIVRALRGS